MKIDYAYILLLMLFLIQIKSEGILKNTISKNKFEKSIKLNMNKDVFKIESVGTVIPTNNQAGSVVIWHYK